LGHPEIEKRRCEFNKPVLPNVATLLIADLSLLSETRAVGGLVAARHPRIAVLINNAGVFQSRPIATAEGHDSVLATNLLSPFVLTQVLLPSLVAGAPSRIVNIGASTSDRARIDPDNLVLGPRWAMRRANSQSKLALMMVTFSLAKRLRGTGVVANVVHPGLVATGLVRSGGVIGLVWRGLALTALTGEQGADTPLYAALSRNSLRSAASISRIAAPCRQTAER
jgi:NAD(P)-dependent dehydrogenase (short-subunit alcohol dehydrogenase family)